MFVLGKIESGSCRVGDRCVLLPNRTRVEISNIFYEDEETDYSISGENVRLKLKHLDDDSQEISVGSVLSRVGEVPCQVGRMFEAQIALIDVKNLVSIGFTQEEKHGTVYGCLVLYTARNPGRRFTTAFYREYDRIRTIYRVVHKLLYRSKNSISQLPFDQMN